MNAASLKQVRIKTGVLRRVGKEKASYRKEADAQKLKVESMRNENKDELEIKKMNEVMQETLMMIPECHRRLERALDDLKNVLKASVKDDGQEELPEVVEAKKAIEEAEDFLKIT